MTCGVYKIRNRVTEEKYVGSSIDIEFRTNDHIDQLVAGVHPNVHLQRAWNKYGPSKFSFEILERCEPHELLQREQSYLPKEGTARALKEQGFYNMNPFADSSRGREVTAETKAKISKAIRGRVSTFKGKTLSESARAKISQARKGKPLSEEHKAKIKAGNKSWMQKGKPAKPRTEEARRNQSLGQLGKTRKPLNEETKKKISESLKKRNKGSL